jgi:hypothetical protein
VFYQCNNGALWWEDTNVEPPEAGDIIPRLQIPIFESNEKRQLLEGIGWKEYQTLLGEYLTRDITNQEYAERAFKGLSGALSTSLDTVWYRGLPVKWFNESMVFEHQFHVPELRKGFPSWSWCGWD